MIKAAVIGSAICNICRLVTETCKFVSTVVAIIAVNLNIIRLITIKNVRFSTEITYVMAVEKRLEKIF